MAGVLEADVVPRMRVREQEVTHAVEPDLVASGQRGIAQSIPSAKAVKPKRSTRCVSAALLTFALLVARWALEPRAAWADHCTDAQLKALLIDERDLTGGYVEDPELSGRVDLEDLAGRTLSKQERVEAKEAHCIYQRTWVDEASGRTLTASVFEMLSGKAAAEMLRGVTDRVAVAALDEFDVPEAKDSRGFVLTFTDPETGEPVGEQTPVMFRRGRFLFMLSMIAPTADVADARAVAARQAQKAPKGPTGPAEPFSTAAFVGQMSGSLLFLVALYLLLVAGFARIRDPAASGSGGDRRVTPIPEGHRTSVVDVSPLARRARTEARIRFAAQVFGLSLLVPGVVPAFWPGSLLPSAVGLLFLIGPRWLVRSQERRKGAFEPRKSRRLFTGRRTGHVTLMFTLALVLLSGAALVAGLTGVILARGESTLVPSQSGDDAEIPAAVVAAPGALLALALAAGAVGFYRRGRRLGALDARALMNRDERPIVLYLRSFSDDDVTIRTAVAGRRSLVEQLSPRRFDRFEEAVAWELNRTGPVVALNPPGTDLAPLGAARTSLPNEDWQSVIGQWMESAALIVLNAPPRELTKGFEWELEQIDANDLWFKTLFVCPPLPNHELRQRWARFHSLLSNLGVAEEGFPVDPASVLVASTDSAGGWSIAVARDRTEWSYVAALRQLTVERPVPAPTGSSRSMGHNVGPVQRSGAPDDADPSVEEDQTGDPYNHPAPADRRRHSRDDAAGLWGRK